MAKKGEQKDRASIVIRKEEIVEGGHHGGAWKVAYADFVTAMMAFFLLMWLLNATTEQQRKGIADYFAPSNVFGKSTSGSGQPFGGHTPLDDGSLVSDRGAQSMKPGKSTAVVAPDDPQSDMSDQLVAPRLLDSDGDPAEAQITEPGNGGRASTPVPDQGDGAASPPLRQPHTPLQPTQMAINEAAEQERKVRAAAEAHERFAFQQAADQIREAVRTDPSLAELASQLSIDVTPQGLRVQLMDEDRQPMFALGSASPNERARLILRKIAPVLAKLTEPIAITGHTDAAPYRGSEGSNWQLSSDRADATRRLLADGGVPDARFKEITGAADRDLLLPADPLAAANRRMAIMVLRTAKSPVPLLSTNHQQQAAAAPTAASAKPAGLAPLPGLAPSNDPKITAPSASEHQAAPVAPQTNR